MNEADFWPALEYRVCREFGGMSAPELRRLWCDGFIPQEYFVAERRHRIVGKVWICTNTNQDEWDFTLRLSKRGVSSRSVDWASQLPPDDVTGWLSLERHRRHILIEPAAAVPDKNPLPSGEGGDAVAG